MASPARYVNTGNIWTIRPLPGRGLWQFIQCAMRVPPLHVCSCVPASPILLCIHPSTRPSIHPSVHPSLPPSVLQPTVHPSTHPSIHPSIHTPLQACAHHPTHSHPCKLTPPLPHICTPANKHCRATGQTETCLHIRAAHTPSSTHTVGMHSLPCPLSLSLSLSCAQEGKTGQARQVFFPCHSCGGQKLA